VAQLQTLTNAVVPVSYRNEVERQTDLRSESQEPERAMNPQAPQVDPTVSEYARPLQRAN
jgi:hypothetical protein